MRFLLAFTFAAVLLGCTPMPDVSMQASPSASRPAADGIAAVLNQSRRTQGLSSLNRSARLDRVAAGHAADMVRGGFFSHTSSDGSPLIRRIRNSGYNACFASENIAWGQRSEAAVFSEWMKSPGHRRNILSRKPTQFGFARVDSPKGPFWTMVFARPC